MTWIGRISHIKRVGVVIAFGGVIATGACGPSAATHATQAAPSATAGAPRAAAAVASPNPAPTFATTIAELAGEFGGTAGILIAVPGQPAPTYAANIDRPFVAASLYKLAVLLRVESLVDRGAVSYQDAITIEEVDVTEDGSNELPGTVLTIDRALEEMVTYSDNGAALALVRRYGARGTNAALSDAGIRGFHIAEGRDEDNLVTARALGAFFDLLATRRLVSAGASDRMLVRLERQQINDRLPRELPADVQVAHKTGDLVGLIHDAGLIGAPDGPRIAVVLTSGGTEATAKDLIARVGLAVYSAVLAAAPGPRADPLPFQTLTRAPALSAAGGGGVPLVLALAIVLVALAGLVLVRRAGRPRRRGRRRRSGPMAVWSPDRPDRPSRTDRTARTGVARSRRAPGRT